MKALYLVLIALLVSLYNCRECLDITAAAPEKAKDCNDATFNKDTYYRCCFLDSKVKGMDEIKMCVPLTKAQYDAIGEYIDKGKKESTVEVEKYSLDCNSKYIALSLLSLVLFFF